jgi:hypothetical protein
MITDIIEYISFRGEKLIFVWNEGEPYVAVKPICDQIGLAYQPQHRKLSCPESDATITMMVMVAADGKQREMLCLHLMDLPFWLSGITPSRVKPELADGIRAYRTECKLVLFNHFKARLLGEKRVALNFTTRLKLELFAKNPLWTRISLLYEAGFNFMAIHRNANQPRWRVAMAIDEMFRLELIDAKPEGTPDDAILAAWIAEKLGDLNERPFKPSTNLQADLFSKA